MRDAPLVLEESATSATPTPERYYVLQFIRQEFPKYLDGDVIIIFTSNRVYQLHAHTLRCRSSFFAGLLHESNAREATGRGSKKTPVRYRVEYVLDHGEDIDDFDLGTFKLMNTSTRGSNILSLENRNGKSVNANSRYQDFDNLFRIMYNLDPILPDTNMGAALAACMGLLEAAEATTCAHIVSTIIDNVLLRQGQALYQSIQANPIAWADLSLRVRSGMILQESVIHMVGRWPALDDHSKSHLDPAIRALCERKHSELAAVKKAVDRKLLGLYPTELLHQPPATPPPHTHPQTTKPAAPGRSNYSSKIYLWMAVAYFRQYLSQCLIADPAPADGGYALYARIHRGGSAYLDAAAMRSFHAYFPMSRKAQACLEDRVAVVKEEASRLVRPLIASRCELDQERAGPVGYLTCASVGREDWPWEGPAGGAAAAAAAAAPVVAGGDAPPPSPRRRSRSRSPSPSATPKTYRSRSPIIDPRLRAIPSSPLPETSE
ncbi:hypothetical protein FGG08_005209 [Glutinoglossum americanum]|uniref:BTB domain-containing protein n=1 Tax=Glutinoglossum americanum TaxID=1670608 RepID=A0A9P8I5X3_9PEZI|nr:hypothetical protein FGG08_005209 [Glutinoglossum americanum]